MTSVFEDCMIQNLYLPVEQMKRHCWASILINDDLQITLLMSNYTKSMVYLYRRYISEFSDKQILKRGLLSRMELNNIISYEKLIVYKN
jgi:hypothetical protein